MGILYGAVLQDAIYREMAQTDYEYSIEDKPILLKMLSEVNELSDYKFQYLCELSLVKNPKGSGEIYMRYFPLFESQTVKSILALQIAAEIGKKGAETVLHGYLDFRKSEECISPPDLPWPAVIYVRYDNAFRKMKPKAIKSDLLQLTRNSLDVLGLPFTVRMLASWEIPELEGVLWNYLDDDFLNTQMFGWENNNIPPERLQFRRNQVKFTALESLRYYPTAKYLSALQEFEKSDDKDFVLAAKKQKKFLEKHYGIVF